MKHLEQLEYDQSCYAFIVMEIPRPPLNTMLLQTGTKKSPLMMDIGARLAVIQVARGNNHEKPNESVIRDPLTT